MYMYMYMLVRKVGLQVQQNGMMMVKYILSGIQPFTTSSRIYAHHVSHKFGNFMISKPFVSENMFIGPCVCYQPALDHPYTKCAN